MLLFDGTQHECNTTGCVVEYVAALTPTASLRLTGLKGSPGDTLVLETGNWQLVPDDETSRHSYPHPEGAYIEGTLGGEAHTIMMDEHTSHLREQPTNHVAAQLHPDAFAGAGLGMEAAAHSRETQAHMMHLRIPATLSAGYHPLELVLDRDVRDLTGCV